MFVECIFGVFLVVVTLLFKKCFTALVPGTVDPTVRSVTTLRLVLDLLVQCSPAYDEINIGTDSFLAQLLRRATDTKNVVRHTSCCMIKSFECASHKS